jgi:hypothetical protein
VRIHFIFNNLKSLEADFITHGFCYLRQITECAADLVPIKFSLWQEALLRSLAKFLSSGLARGRTYEMKIRTTAET